MFYTVFMAQMFSSIAQAVSLQNLVTIEDYYAQVVVPLHRVYSISIPSLSGSKGVCPLHEDINPSMGVLLGRNGQEQFNCFGCHATGTVVDFHRQVSESHLTPLTSSPMGIRQKNDLYARDLLSRFGIDLAPVLAQVGTAKVTDRTLTEQQAKLQATTEQVRQVHASYSLADYRSSVVDGLLSVPVQPRSYFNTLLHRMTYQTNQAKPTPPAGLGNATTQPTNP